MVEEVIEELRVTVPVLGIKVPPVLTVKLFPLVMVRFLELASVPSGDTSNFPPFKTVKVLLKEASLFRSVVPLIVVRAPMVPPD